MYKKMMCLLLVLICSLDGMERPTRSAKRKLFESPEKDTPSQALMSPTKGGYGTVSDTPTTPFKEKAKKLVEQNILPLSIHNTTFKPALVTYTTEKGQAHQMLLSDKEDFPKSRLDAEISFKQPVTIAPNGESFLRIFFDKTNNKLEFRKYQDKKPAGFVLIGDYIVNPGNPITIKLIRRFDEHGYTGTGIDIKND